MTNNQTPGHTPRFLLFNWRFVIKTVLIVAAVSCVAATLVLIFVLGKSGTTHAAVSSYFSLSRKQIGPTLIFVGFFMVGFAGFMTWLFALYTSHYIAGPLYRFARNIEILIKQGLVTPIPTRKKDLLKLQEKQMQLSVAKLQQHYGAIRAATEEALLQLNSQSAVSIKKLKELDREVRL
ncbi:MAG: hypothetical protein Q7S51_05100 [Gallionellaceae bacterium]|nr:hypothetical protein [Gallionellaceae bacterium]